MPDVLKRICSNKLQYIATKKASVPFGTLLARASSAVPTLGFASALDRMVDTVGCGIIAELKRASPSRGWIRSNFDLPLLVRDCIAGGASCLSIVTDQQFFQGHDAFIPETRSVTSSLPILRKDFMLDPYQVVETRVLGADAILIILAAVSDTQAAELEAAAIELGLDVLVEVHKESELERALQLSSKLIGINNRNLSTMKVDLTTTERLAKKVPSDKIIVSESGLNQASDLAILSRSGVRRFLIGELLMRQCNVRTAIQDILSWYQKIRESRNE